MDKFGFGEFLWRVAFSLALVFLTFNPTGHSYFHWLQDGFPSITPGEAIAGILLLGLWIFFLKSTLSSLGRIGLLLLVGFFGAVVWWLVARGWLNPEDRSAIAWLVLGMLGIVLGFGMSWSHIRRQLSGQASVDEVRG
jgi:hypothetical protein